MLRIELSRDGMELRCLISLRAVCGENRNVSHRSALNRFGADVTSLALLWNGYALIRKQHATPGVLFFIYLCNNKIKGDNYEM